jgi:hypothetical protein
MFMCRLLHDVLWPGRITVVVSPMESLQLPIIRHHPCFRFSRTRIWNSKKESRMKNIDREVFQLVQKEMFPRQVNNGSITTLRVL